MEREREREREEDEEEEVEREKGDRVNCKWDCSLSPSLSQ